MNDPKRDSRTSSFPSWATRRGNALVVALHVQPGARKTAFIGEHGQRLKIGLRAPPVEGKANEELLRFLATELGLRRSAVQLLSGQASRQKTVLVESDEASAHRLVAQLALRIGAKG